MASSTITLYKNSTQTKSFLLANQGTESTVHKVAGRALACPEQFERILTLKGAKANDLATYRYKRVEQNANTSALASLQIEVRISIPKDQSILNATAVVEGLSMIASAINDNSATSATTANRSAMAEGRDL